MALVLYEPRRHACAIVPSYWLPLVVPAGVHRQEFCSTDARKQPAYARLSQAGVAIFISPRATDVARRFCENLNFRYSMKNNDARFNDEASQLELASTPVWRIPSSATYPQLTSGTLGVTTDHSNLISSSSTTQLDNTTPNTLNVPSTTVGIGCLPSIVLDTVPAESLGSGSVIRAEVLDTMATVMELFQARDRVSEIIARFEKDDPVVAATIERIESRDAFDDAIERMEALAPIPEPLRTPGPSTVPPVFNGLRYSTPYSGTQWTSSSHLQYSTRHGALRGWENSFVARSKE
ncbi:hypothetical protein HGRIS_013692 [Hohenbuehelia grisea]|uniref:Uncharacterized protein n=1 Tax=Hohenbuehelia grisea TaxID=104357 RepID=A0ABR3IWD4_9AGAR